MICSPAPLFYIAILSENLGAFGSGKFDELLEQFGFFGIAQTNNVYADFLIVFIGRLNNLQTVTECMCHAVPHNDRIDCLGFQIGPQSAVSFG